MCFVFRLFIVVFFLSLLWHVVAHAEPLPGSNNLDGYYEPIPEDNMQATMGIDVFACQGVNAPMRIHALYREGYGPMIQYMAKVLANGECTILKKGERIAFTAIPFSVVKGRRLDTPSPYYLIAGGALTNIKAIGK